MFPTYIRAIELNVMDFRDFFKLAATLHTTHKQELCRRNAPLSGLLLKDQIDTHSLDYLQIGRA